MESMKEDLVGIVGQDNVFDDHATLDAYAKDESLEMGIRPWFVVKPSNADQIQKLVKWANETSTPIVPVSSGPPHFYGDSIPSVAGAVIVDLSDMNKILRVDRRNRVCVIEPGVTYEQLEEELAKAGLRMTMPLLPKKNKSVVASLLERQPTIIPKYQYSLTEPLRNCGIIFGNGEMQYSGEAGNGPYDISTQWKNGSVQIDPKGPSATDFHKLVSGAQGSMGIVFWASVKCEVLPSTRKLVMIPSDDLQRIIKFAYEISKFRIGDEFLIVNKTQLANIVGKKSEEIQSIKKQLPAWIAIIGVAGRDLIPDEKVNIMVEDIKDFAQKHGLKVETGLPKVSNTQVLDAILNTSDEPYFKQNYKGACQELFFMTTMNKTPMFIDKIYDYADKMAYAANDIGVYIQPLHQGTSCHCEFDFPYNPEDKEEREQVKELYVRASKELINDGAYYSRPYGLWSSLVFRRDADSREILKKLKKIFDPNNIMNPGKLVV